MTNSELLALRAATLEKVARFSPNQTAFNLDLPGALKIVGLIGAGVIVSSFIRKMLDYAEEKYIQFKSPEYYKQMLDKNPQLLEADPAEVMSLWDTLYKNSPSLAQDPVAAGAFIVQNVGMRTMRDLGGPGLDTYKTLIDIEKSKRGVGTGQDFTSSGLSFFKESL